MIKIPAQLAADLIDTCHTFGQRQWCLATGGNFSARIDTQHCLITQSGKDKSRLGSKDLMICTLDGAPIDPGLQPSAEIALHTCLYRHNEAIGAVLHTHSVHSTLMSRHAGHSIFLEGFEMQKALRGNARPEESIAILVFDNDQDIEALADRITSSMPVQPGLLVRGHGLYAWGRDIDEARRHVEGFEFLLACLWQEKLLAAK